MDSMTPITKLWRDGLEQTQQHILQYQQTKDEQYYTDHVYLPLLVLSNYNYNKYFTTQGKDRDYYVNGCVGHLTSLICKYDPALGNPYSYFNLVCRNYMLDSLRRLNRNNIYTSLDELDDTQRDYVENHVEHDDTPDMSEYHESLREKLKRFIKNKTKNTKNGRHIKECLTKFLDGQITIGKCTEGTIPTWAANTLGISVYQLAQTRRMVGRKFNKKVNKF